MRNLPDEGAMYAGQRTPGKERRVRRWEHEAVIDAMQARLDREPEKMHLRRQTAEHPFGEPEPRKNKPPFSPIGALACGQSAVNHASPRSRLEEFRGFPGHSPLQAPDIGAVLPLARMRGRAGSSGLGAKPDGRELQCAIRLLGTDRVAAPVIWAVRGPASAGV